MGRDLDKVCCEEAGAMLVGIEINLKYDFSLHFMHFRSI